MATPLAPGDRVRVLATFERKRVRYEQGEVLTFERSDFSGYDGAVVWLFRRADGRPVVWYIHRAMRGDPKRADDPDEWSRHFERL